MTAQARATLRRNIRAALAQMEQDIPAFQIRTAASVTAAKNRCEETIVAAAETFAGALAQPTLFDASEAAS